MCWWSIGVDGTVTPTIAATRGDQMPAALTTTSVSIGPWSVSTRRTARSRPSSMPVTRVPVRMRTPSSLAAFATAWVAVCGSRCPSPGTHTAPYSDSGLAAGMSRRVSSAETSSTSRPMPCARLTPRCCSMNCSREDASRRLPTVSNTPSSRYSSIE